MRTRRNPDSHGPIRAIPTDVAIDVAKRALSVARDRGVDCAIAGGLAMQLHGFVRNTKDVDVFASRDLAVGRRIRPVSFGGYIHEVDHPWGLVDLDVIVRNDHDAELYAEAAARPVRIHGLPVVRVEYMLIIKHLAGRPKDQADFRFLATEKPLKLNAIKRILMRLYGRGGYHIYDDITNDVEVAKWESGRERGK